MIGSRVLYVSLLMLAAKAFAGEEISDNELGAVSAQSGMTFDVEFRLNANADGSWNGVPNKFSYKSPGNAQWLVLNQNSGRMYLAGLTMDVDEVLGIPAIVVAAPGKLYFRKWNIQTISVEATAVAQSPTATPVNQSVIGFQTDAVWNLNGQARFFQISPSAIKVPY